MATGVSRALYLSMLAVWLWSAPLEAQSTTRVDLITVSPFGWPEGRVDAEWQTCASDYDGNVDCVLQGGWRLATGRSDPGRRGSDPADGRRFVELDGVLRVKPSLDSGCDPAGWTAGLRASLMYVSGSVPFPGLGIEVDRTWRFGRRFVVGAGAGVKGVMVIDDGVAAAWVPAARLRAGWIF